MSQVIMYSRPGCGLCDEAREVIESIATQGRLAFEFREISIEGDDALELEFGIRIPVVLIDGKEFCEYRVEAAELAEALA